MGLAFAHRIQCVWQKQVGDLTVLLSRLGELLMELGLDGLVSSNSLLLEDGEKQKRVRSEPTVSLFRSDSSVCICIRVCVLRRQHAWLFTQAPAACFLVCLFIPSVL